MCPKSQLKKLYSSGIIAKNETNLALFESNTIYSKMEQICQKYQNNVKLGLVCQTFVIIQIGRL